VITYEIWSHYLYELEMWLYDCGHILIDKAYKEAVDSWDAISP